MYTVSNWMLFGHCSSGVVLDYFVHIPPSLFSIIVQLLRFTIPIFFSSLLYCLFHSMLLVMCGGGGGRPARSPLETNDPQTRDLSFLDCWRAVCSFFLRHCIPGVEHYTHWIADGQTPERERGLYMTGPVKIFRPWRTWWNRSATRFFFFLSFFLSSLIQIESCTHTMAIKNEKRYIPHVVSLHM